jgi:hypothetical protein
MKPVVPCSPAQCHAELRTCFERSRGNQEDGKFQTVEAFGLDRVFKGWAKLELANDEIFTRESPVSTRFTLFSKLDHERPIKPYPAARAHLR